MEDKTALEELQFIRKVIEESKRSMIYNGVDYILWGIIITIGLVSTYFFTIYEFYKSFSLFWIWAVLVPAGWVFSVYYGIKTKTKQPKTFAGRLLSAVWASAGVAMMIVGFVGPLARAYSPLFISPVICIILGVAYYVTGTIVESRWVRNLSFGWWAGAIFMLAYHNIITLMVMALMMLCFQTIPGIIMYRKFKNINK